MYEINLSQTPPEVPAVIGESIAEKYARVQDWVKEQFGEEFCRSIFPQQPIYLPPKEREGSGLAWYVWLGIGLILGKVF